MKTEEIWKKLEIYSKKINQYYILSYQNANNQDYITNLLNELYTYIKYIAFDFVENEKLNYAFSLLTNDILKIENRLPDYYIIDSNLFMNSSSSSKTPTEVILNSIVRKSQAKFMKKYRNPIDLNTLNLRNECYNFSCIVKQICQENYIRCQKIVIHPGFTNKIDLYEGNGYHYFNLVQVRNKLYIIDCSYRQFFLLDNNLLKRIGVPNLSGCEPGAFMCLNQSRMNTALTLLKQGWIELNNENGKNYFDGFALSYRNGHYYEQTNDYSFTTNYSLNDYQNFLTGQDNQINHESPEVLCRQKDVCQNLKL